MALLLAGQNARLGIRLTCSHGTSPRMTAAMRLSFSRTHSWPRTTPIGQQAVFISVLPATRWSFKTAIPVYTKQLARRPRILPAQQRRYSAPTPPPSSPPPSKEPLTTRLRALTPIPHENIWTIPNILTFSRLFAAPVIGYMILHEQHLWAFSLFVYAGLTDLVDGWIARHFSQSTVVGTVIDPMADKTLMTIVTVTLAANGSMPVYLAVLILGRDILLAISAIYYRWISLPPPKTFARYWDFSLPSAEVRPTGISKVNTALQLGLIGATMGMPLVQLGAWAPVVLKGWQWTVAVTTVWSGASYVYSKDAVKILNQQKDESDPGGEQTVVEKDEIGKEKK